MKETVIFNGEEPLYFVCNHCAHFIKENTKLLYESDVDINIDILARCPNCNGILYITKNKQLA